MGNETNETRFKREDFAERKLINHWTTKFSTILAEVSNVDFKGERKKTDLRTKNEAETMAKIIDVAIEEHGDEVVDTAWMEIATRRLACLLQFNRDQSWIVANHIQDLHPEGFVVPQTVLETSQKAARMQQKVFSVVSGLEDKSDGE